MAGLAPSAHQVPRDQVNKDPLDTPQTPLSIHASAQFKAVAYLRWRLFANSFRRKEGLGELAAKFVLYPFAVIVLAGPLTGATLGSFYVVSQEEIERLAVVFWLIFLLQIVVSINISPPGLSFDPESLIRFPLSFPRYLVIRLFLGLLSASTIAGTLALLGAAAGASVANPALGRISFLAAISLAVTNMLFIRMVFAWIDRWLSTRRAREALTGILLLGTVFFQYLNISFNGLGHRTSRAAQAAKIARIEHVYHAASPLLMHLPPGLAAASLIDQSLHSTTVALIQIFGVLLFGASFLTVFAWRMHFEYRGERLSDTSLTRTAQTQPVRVTGTAQVSAPTTFGLPPIVAACLQREFLYLRRNVSQFYGLLVPIAMVFLFAGRTGNFVRASFTFPAAVVYSFLGISTLSYNSLGLDAAGVQTYFLAPIRMRSVFIAKNLFNFALAAFQLILVYALLFFTSGAPPLLISIATVCWLVFATFANVAIGNWRSLTAPKKMDPGKIARKQASQLSALISIGFMLVTAAAGAGLYYLGGFLGLPWLPIPCLLLLAAGAIAFYLAGLNRIDAQAYTHRETILEELCKAS